MDINPEELTDHDKAMINVAEQGDPNDPSEVKLPSEVNQGGNDRPEWLPEEFESEDEFREWYDSLDEEGDEDDNADDFNTDDSDDDESDVDEEFELSEAEVELRLMKAHEIVGGAEAYQELAAFASENLSEDQLAVYNMAVEGANTDVALFAVQALQAMSQVHNFNTFGMEGNVTTPNAGVPPVVQGYANQSEMMQDMADPRYYTDELFNLRVQQKLALSNF